MVQDVGQIVGRLTERELEILRLLALGLRDKEIAKRVCRSVKTVEKHASNIRAKLGIHNRAGLMLFAAENRLIPLSLRLPDTVVELRELRAAIDEKLERIVMVPHPMAQTGVEL